MPFSPGYIPGRVSIIIISYNYGNFIDHAIQSALSQNVEDLEIIVVDDGSTDGTSRIIKPYKNRVKYIYQNNAGQAAARNKGIEYSTGEFIQFLDSDDILGPAKIATQLDYFYSHPDVYVAVSSNRLFSRVKSDHKPKVHGSWRIFKRNLDIHMCFFNIAPPHAFLYRREAVDRTGPFDSSVDNCEDYDFIFRAALKGYIPHYTPHCMVYYRRHGKSVTAHKMRQYFIDAEIHKRVSESLNKFPHFPRGHRLEGLIAFAAGAAKTAERLFLSSPEKSDELIQMVYRQIQSARESVDFFKGNLNFPVKLYSLKLLSSLDLPCFVNRSLAELIKERLLEILHTLHGPKTVRELILKTLVSAAHRDNQWNYERILLAYLPIKYLLNRFLPITNRLNYLK